MTDKTTQNDPKGRSVGETLKDSLMIIVTLIFVLLYAAAFTGKLDPLKDNTMLLRLEPIIFILIGYYFARLPARQNEQSLKDEIVRQTQKADAAQFAKEKAQLEREMLEEKIRNARTALKNIVSMETNNHKNVQNEALKAAFGILDS
jgi:hypothetical protein